MMFKCLWEIFETTCLVAFETAGYFWSFLCGVISYYSWTPSSLYWSLAHPIFLSFSFSSPPISPNPLSAFLVLSPSCLTAWQRRQSCGFCTPIKQNTKEWLIDKLQPHAYRFMARRNFRRQAIDKQNGSSLSSPSRRPWIQCNAKCEGGGRGNGKGKTLTSSSKMTMTVESAHGEVREDWRRD